ncbi:N-methyl-L-tryptophan oxidase [Sinomonas sp. R1AF57]|uniref:N-methyl-L-tryptophan oxidase n=1 Tax=Sinomonas sp. R1AF57 TaxID=2020377 RepID=UPI000B5E0060|nr:N-methyl-L-tryptophan oxidase [Sinomonas sp. R1AF57]ASN51214.1 N-methyltryptophan oxidase [Sinomonas sp. R1AF57]
MQNGYSHIVIGAGAIGSAAAYWLSRRPGTRVLVVEQFGLVNTLNSSRDVSRIIRHAYHSSDYTKLTPAMFEAWAEVEERSGMTLYVKTGGLDLATSAEASIAELDAYRGALAAEGIPYEDLTAAEIRARYPQWHIDDDVTGMYQEAGGLVDIRATVAAHTSLALAAGVQFLPDTRVTGVGVLPDSVTVRTDGGEFHAQNLVVAAASWLPELMPDLGLDYPLTLSQEQVTYFTSPNLGDFAPEKFPIWIFHGDETFYGFPVYGEPGVKLARDMRGRFITSSERVFEGDDDEAAILRSFLERHLPGAVGPVWANKTCVYDMAPDRDFVLDTLPGSPHVAVFNGAGHAGKFASLIGKILAELTVDGAASLPIGPFSLTRPALTDPGFVPAFRLT